MNKINFILVLLLLINSCNQNNNKDKEIKSKNKRDLKATQEVQKTPEEALREKLNDTEKTNLDFLKEALGNESDFNKLLSHDEYKIKSVLEHIKSELEKCTGDNANEQKNTFKQVVKGALNGGENLDNFKEQASSACQAGAGG
ncbi:Mlp family lipoprotein (plasmid) [Borrelia nietonii YOR]|nr:Mlp family lipoprotein [Borrelia nietonii]UPA10082.1 Mlp family lipoprotein [Borrelia nietonii YOR]